MYSTSGDLQAKYLRATFLLPRSKNLTVVDAEGAYILVFIVSTDEDLALKEEDALHGCFAHYVEVNPNSPRHRRPRLCRGLQWQTSSKHLLP